MKNVLVKLRDYYEQAHSTERQIIRYILDNPEKASDMTIHDLSKETFASASTIIRLCKRNGFKGYKDFTRSLIYELAKRETTLKQEKSEITKSDNIKEITEKVTHKNIISLEDTERLLDDALIEKVIDHLIDADKIAVFALGSSFNVARDLQQKFMRLNKHVLINEDWHMQWLAARNLTGKDFAIIISYSGETEELIKCIHSLKENNVRTVSITKYGSNPVSDLCDYNLFVSAKESTFRSGAMASRISQLLVVDIIYTGYANRHYEKSLEMISKTHIKKEKKQ